MEEDLKKLYDEGKKAIRFLLRQGRMVLTADTQKYRLYEPMLPSISKASQSLDVLFSIHLFLKKSLELTRKIYGKTD